MKHCLRRAAIRLRNSQGVLLRLRINFGDNVARFDDLPDIDPARYHFAVDAKGEALFGAGPDMASERYGFALRMQGGDNDADGSDVRWQGRRSLGLAACKTRQKREKKDVKPHVSTPEIFLMLTLVTLLHRKFITAPSGYADPLIVFRGLVVVFLQRPAASASIAGMDEPLPAFRQRTRKAPRWLKNGPSLSFHDS